MDCASARQVLLTPARHSRSTGGQFGLVAAVPVAPLLSRTTGWSGFRQTFQRALLAKRRAPTALDDTAMKVWLESTCNGSCGGTSGELGDCSGGDKGSFRMSRAVAHKGVHAFAQACLERCRTCAQCRHVSFSLEAMDCSWYSSCPEVLSEAALGVPMEWEFLSGPAIDSAGKKLGETHPVVAACQQ